MDKIVAHRGYHDVADLPTRPLENTLGAYQLAWDNFSYCECDIIASTDGILFLCHDDTFERLADPSDSPLVHKDASSLSSDELDHIRLKDGTTPTRLAQVLEYAKHCSKEKNSAKYLIVELKRGQRNAFLVSTMTDFVKSHPALAAHIAVIMSFDVNMMLDLKRALKGEEAVHPAQLLVLTSLSQLSCLQTNFVSECVTLAQGLDGIYLQYQPEFITAQGGGQLNSVVKQVGTVGIWNSSQRMDEEDGLKTYSQLVPLGVSFVNSDLPEEELILLGLSKQHHLETQAMDPLSFLWRSCCMMDREE